MARKNSEIYLDTFNAIEKKLRRMIGADRYKRFYQLVDETSSINLAVREFALDLKEFADLRNAIVHERTDEHILAEPNDETVEKIKQIAQLISCPPALQNLVSPEVFILKADDPVGVAIQALFEKQFSQAPVYRNKKFIGLLTANTITRWLGANVLDEIFSLQETTTGQVLKYTEDPEHVLFVRADYTVFEALADFHKFTENGKRLEAILITETGEREQPLLGMLTIWDLPNLHRTIEIKSRGK